MVARTNERPGREPAIALFGRCAFGIILRAAMLVGIALVFTASASLRAQSDEGQKISVNYDHQCGDLHARQVRHLATSGAHADVTVKSASYWNASGLVLEKGVSYKIEPINREATWSDASHKTTVGGWWPEDGVMSWFMMLARPLLRSPKHDLFQLMGMVYRKCADDDECRACAKQFAVSEEGYTFEATMDGEFCSYANDLPFTYGNNSGEIVIRVTRQ